MKLELTSKAMVKNNCWAAADKYSNKTGKSKAFSPLLYSSFLLGLHTGRAQQPLAKKDVVCRIPDLGLQSKPKRDLELRHYSLLTDPKNT